MAVPTVDEIRKIIEDIGQFIEDGLEQNELEFFLQGDDFKKIKEYVKENGTIPDTKHKDTTSPDPNVFGNIIKAQKAANNRAKMVGRAGVKNPKLEQAKYMQKLLLGLKDNIIKEEISEATFDIDEYKTLKEQEIIELNKKIEANNKAKELVEAIASPVKKDKDIQEYRSLDSMKKAIELYEKVRKDLEAENKKPEAKRDADKIEALKEDLKTAKTAIGASGVYEKYKEVEVDGENVSIAEALKDNKDISKLITPINADLTTAKGIIDAKGVDDLFADLTSAQKSQIAKGIGKPTLDDADITTDMLMDLLDESNKTIRDLNADNRKKIKEKDTKEESFNEIKKLSIVKDAKNTDKSTLYNNYAGKEEKDLVDSLNIRKNRIDFWKKNIKGPFKWIRARFRARKGNIAETKAFAKIVSVDRLLKSAELEEKSYTESFRESLKVNILP